MSRLHQTDDSLLYSAESPLEGECGIRRPVVFPAFSPELLAPLGVESPYEGGQGLTSALTPHDQPESLDERLTFGIA